MYVWHSYGSEQAEVYQGKEEQHQEWQKLRRGILIQIIYSTDSVAAARRSVRKL